VRYVERMGRIEQPATLTDCKYLDSCVTFTAGTATTAVTGAGHLEGQTAVYAVADGRVRGPFTVTGGAFTLPKAASTVHYGLLYTPLVRLLPATMMVDGYGKGRQMNVAEATLRVVDSCSFSVATHSDESGSGTARAAPIVNNDRMLTRDVAVPVDGSWNRGAQCEVSQSSPLPLTIVSVTLNVDVGGPS
jgi:hypothetical protein